MCLADGLSIAPPACAWRKQEHQQQQKIRQKSAQDFPSNGPGMVSGGCELAAKGGLVDLIQFCCRAKKEPRDSGALQPKIAQFRPAAFTLGVPVGVIAVNCCHFSGRSSNRKSRSPAHRDASATIIHPLDDKQHRFLWWVGSSLRGGCSPPDTHQHTLCLCVDQGRQSQSHGKSPCFGYGRGQLTNAPAIVQ